MGYETYFELSSLTPFTITASMVEDYLLHSGLYAFDSGNVSGTGKWDRWQEEMKAFSKAFPDVLFLLTGSGDEADDLWKAYFKDGKMQLEKAVITYGEFDESKLKE